VRDSATYARPSLSGHSERVGTLPLHLAWFAGGSVLAFAVPYLFASVLDLHHDLYYGLYFAVALVFLASYVALTHTDTRSLFTRGWRLSLALAAPATAFVVVNVLSRDSTPGASGLYGVFEAGWRGVAYGTVDALLLTAFPGAVALNVVDRRLSGLRTHLLFAALMLPLVLVITATYHLGYEQFREDGIGPPEIGNTVISVPMLVSGNPIGSIVTHASMHVTADIHSYETDIFLPPQTDAP
jgi:hypothetical protein